MSFTQSSRTPVGSRRARQNESRDSLHTIGDIARDFGVTLRTLRFYEDKGLLKPFREGSARLYSADHRAKLTLILKGKQLGFTLGEIRELIADTASGNKNGTLSLKPEQIELQIHHLERQRDGIDDAIAQLRAAHARLEPSHVG